MNQLKKTKLYNLLIYPYKVAVAYLTLTGIDRKNALFALLSPAQKRVKIAWDVIHQLNAEAIIALSGKYVSKSDTLLDIDHACFYDTKTSDEAAKAIQTSLLNPELKDCYTCALGGMFLSSVRVGNRYSGKIAVGSDDEPVYDQLEKYFDIKQLAIIEYAFENDTVAGRMRNISRYHDPILAHEAGLESFRTRYTESSDRLRAIMNNIIHNKGTFVPA
jgi:hypothetical protein